MIQDIREEIRQKYAQANTNKLSYCGAEESDNPVKGNILAEMLIEDKEYILRTAADSDLPAIDKLLSENGLTTSGVRENLSNFLVAECEEVIGVIGIEFAGHGAMLRSMVISKEVRKRGLATALVNYSLKIARAAGVLNIYILTNTAETFASRWGFYKIKRSEIPADLMESSALNNFCPSSSICMKLELK